MCTCLHSQVYLLAAPASASSLVVFRTHLGLLNGAVLALLFPVTDAYSLPGEVLLNNTYHGHRYENGKSHCDSQCGLSSQW